MKKLLLLSIIVFSARIALKAQDTFSIVAADSATREVGSAGASCVNLVGSGLTFDFLGELFPDTGAINSQASYLPGNQANARNRMRAGDDPWQLIHWVNANDVGSDSTPRQYGVVKFMGNSPVAQGYTGTGCMNYKNHINGKINGIAYSIQGNILLGQQILDSMEARFRNATGDLRCRLMAALQGAKVTGADTRCTPYGTSSLFAFIKVSQPTDAPGAPSFRLGVIATGTSGDPIDSLQKLFNAAHHCSGVGLLQLPPEDEIRIIPNPASDDIIIKMADAAPATIRLYDMLGTMQVNTTTSGKETTVGAADLPRGMYIVEVASKDKRYRSRVLLR